MSEGPSQEEAHDMDVSEALADPRSQAAATLLQSSGCQEVQLSWVAGPPVVWAVFGYWAHVDAWEAAAAMDPLTAILRLAEQAVHGGVCPSCDRPAAFDLGGSPPLEDIGICWLSWADDHFVRGCQR